MVLPLQSAQQTRKYIYLLPYDIVVSILYAWCIFQSYLYMSKTVATDGGLWVFVAVYILFMLFIRSFIGLILMNLLAIVTLPKVLANPVVLQAGDKVLSFQPFIGDLVQIVVAIVQLVLFTVLIHPFCKTLSKRLNLLVGTCVLAVVTTIFTTLVSGIA